MWAGLVHACDEEPHAVRSFTIVLGIRLRAVADLGDNALEGDGSAVGHFRSEGLLLHEVEEDAGVGGETGDGNTEVVVYADDFLLVGGEFFGISLRFELKCSC